MKFKRVQAVVVFLSCIICAGIVTAGDKEVEFYPAATESERKLPFSDAVRVGDLLFLSGKIGIIPGTMDLPPGGIQPETRQTHRHAVRWDRAASPLGPAHRLNVLPQ